MLHPNNGPDKPSINGGGGCIGAWQLSLSKRQLKGNQLCLNTELCDQHDRDGVVISIGGVGRGRHGVAGGGRGKQGAIGVARPLRMLLTRLEYCASTRRRGPGRDPSLTMYAKAALAAFMTSPREEGR